MNKEAIAVLTIEKNICQGNAEIQMREGRAEEAERNVYRALQYSVAIEILTKG